MFKAGSSALKSQPLEVHKESVTGKKATPKSGPARGAQQFPEPRHSPKDGGKPLAKRPKSELKASKKPIKGRESSRLAIDFGSDESDADDVLELPQKRSKRDTVYQPDLKRRVWSRNAFSNDDSGIFSMVHAADIPSVDKSIKFQPSFEGLSDGAEIALQYPSASQKER